MKKRFLIILLFLSFGTFYPQDADSLTEIREIQYDKISKQSPVDLDEKKIEEYQSEKEFSYINTVEKDTWWTRFKKWINAKYNQVINWLFGDYKANGIMAAIIAVIPILLILTLLGLVAWLFSRLNPGGKILQKPKTSEVFLSEEEELVKNEDLPALMKEAIQKGQFRLAVRYYYLQELRKLDELELIHYEYQKTNRDYSNEIKNPIIKAQFSNITKLYEFIWYGSFQVSESDFRLAEKGFIRMEDSLKNLSHE
ncbi:DUF4129 domain-containing protein [Gramella sp. MAR_2010_147]|uniref:DUF4129 domain-containing protein n=1 Tax=Gramella sp. MAR_2010_147 TaxID=1250205 RepID=UPI00087B9D63|nr:DUF4129 domain-containing protein [Gramella sp. MAR_2010_147]SDR89083.1 protein of unknown function [Gramella sp. MAR_2010_147]